MITRVEINNINSIGCVDLNFKKAKYQFLQNLILNNEVSNPIAVYGHNASGKSSLLDAFYQLVLLMINEPEKMMSFRFNFATALRNNLSISDVEESSIKLYFSIENDLYEYYIATNYYAITKEYLIYNGKRLFLREEKEYRYARRKRRIDSPLFPVLRELSTDTSNSQDPIFRAFSHISNMAVIKSTRVYAIKTFKNMNPLDVIVDKSSDVKQILSTYRKFPLYDVVNKTNSNGEKQYSIVINTGKKKVFLPYVLSSTGMHNQSFLLSALLTLPERGIMIIDEIESGLHPSTIMDFIKIAEKKGVQLMFSCHNTNVLSQLRPDNVYFANWKGGESSYKRLSDIYPNIREVNNIEKMYLASVFDEDIEGKNE